MALKKTSSTIVVSSNVLESAANTFTSQQVDLQLNPLDNEVFVVVGINLDPDAPDSVAGTSTTVNASVSTTSRTTVGTIADSNVIAGARTQIITNAAMTPDGGIPFSREDPLVMPLDMEYLAIIATNDFFVNIEGIGNGNAKNCRARLYGYRAKADASTYAALVQSELLTA
tara:strand:- start:59 stop:571 length:513 start_codon:yes stop_codon:yes gene_type:complete